MCSFIQLKNPTGDTIVSQSIANNYSILVMSSPRMTAGEYTLWDGDHNCKVAVVKAAICAPVECTVIRRLLIGRTDNRRSDPMGRNRRKVGRPALRLSVRRKTTNSPIMERYLPFLPL